MSERRLVGTDVLMLCVEELQYALAQHLAAFGQTRPQHAERAERLRWLIAQLGQALDGEGNPQ